MLRSPQLRAARAHRTPLRAVLLVAAVTATLLPAPASPALAAAPTASTVPTALTDPTASTTPSLAAAARSAPPSCTDVLLVGADGNGERPSAGKVFGPTVARVAATYTSQVGTTRSVRQYRVGATTTGLAKLTRGHRRTDDAAKAITAGSLRAWRSPVGPAITRTDRVLATAMSSCPDQQVVLVGYAQGAAVVHGLLTRLGQRKALGRVVGAVLVSDPDRRARSRGVRAGVPAAAADQGGLLARRGMAVPPDVPATTTTFAAWNLCARHDLVCAPGRTRVAAAARVARSYASARNAGITVPTDGLLVRTRMRPAPTPRAQSVVASTDTPLRHQLAVDVDGRAAPGVRWNALTDLPAGLTLSDRGVLSGIPTEDGTTTVDYTVRGTAPATSPMRGAVTIAVSPSATGTGAGGQNTCQTRADGTALCSGRNDWGQVGDGTTERRLTPTPVLGADWALLRPGGSSTCGIKTTGRLYCWGLNNYAQTGRPRSGPVLKPRAVGTDTDWTDVATSWSHACATKESGGLWCWGQGLRGSLGNGRTDRYSETPVQVGTQSWRQVAAGGWHTCGVRNDGSAWCWGDNMLGQLGLGDTTRRVAPKRVGTADDWVQLSTSFGHTCGVRRNGSMACWGLNDRGQLGDGTGTSRLRPVPVVGTQVWTAVTVTDSGTCGLDSTGATYCWGDNRYGQVRAGAADRVLVPQRADAPAGTNRLVAGWMHVCASTARGSTSCWGSNEVGQLGLPQATPSRKPSAPPADVPAGPGARQSARRGPLKVKVMTFNVLGSMFTGPGGHMSDWAPARLRMEWADNLIQERGASLVGFQELQPDQAGSFIARTRGRWALYPGNTMGYSPTPQSVGWDQTVWKVVAKTTYKVPYMEGLRPQPIVRLEHRATGQQIYLTNVHYSPGDQEADRDQATKLTIAQVQRLQKTGLPVFLTGDFNDRQEVHCKVTGQTNLIAANTNSGGRPCRAPAEMRVDQIFASHGSFSGHRTDQDARVQRTTDHSIQVATFTIP